MPLLRSILLDVPNLPGVFECCEGVWNKHERRPKESRVPKPVYQQTAELMEAEVANELVALDVQSGSCFGFNEVATRVWRSLAEPKDFDQLRDELMQVYEVDADRCTSELRDLLGQMQHEGLIRTL